MNVAGGGFDASFVLIRVMAIVTTSYQSRHNQWTKNWRGYKRKGKVRDAEEGIRNVRRS